MTTRYHVVRVLKDQSRMIIRSYSSFEPARDMWQFLVDSNSQSGMIYEIDVEPVPEQATGDRSAAMRAEIQAVLQKYNAEMFVEEDLETDNLIIVIQSIADPQCRTIFEDFRVEELI